MTTPRILSAFIIISLVIIVLYIHKPTFNLLSQMDFSYDDWVLRTHFKLLGEHPYQEFYSYYKYRSAYFAYQTFYIGTLEKIFGTNPPLLSHINLVIKILAALSVYPLVLIMFKKRLLAYLTTILVACNYNSFATLEFIMKGADYFGILFMSLFFTIYSYIIRNNIESLKWTLLLTLFFVLSLLSSPARVYPLLIIPIFVEIFILLKHRSKKGLLNSLKRLIVIFFPLLVVALKDPQQYIFVVTHTPGVFAKLANGQWDHVLVPISGLGLSLFPKNLWGDFGIKFFISPQSLIRTLLSTPLLVFGPLTYLICWSLLRKPLRATVVVLILNLILDLVAYYILNISGKIPVAFVDFYPALIGNYCLILALFFLGKWLFEESNDEKILALAIGPLFSLVFVFLTWILADQNLNFTRMHYYLNTVSLGSSFFLAVWIFSVYEKISTTKNKLAYTAPVFLVLALFPLYYTNSTITQLYFQDVLVNGREITANNQMNNQMQFYLDKYQILDFTKPVLFIFDESGENQSSKIFYENGFTSYFLYWIHVKNNTLRPGCVGILPADIDLSKIKGMLTEKAGKSYFYYYGFCVRPNDKLNSILEEVLYSPEDVYFFQLKTRHIIDVRKGWMEKLNLI